MRRCGGVSSIRPMVGRTSDIPASSRGDSGIDCQTMAEIKGGRGRAEGEDDVGEAYAEEPSEVDASGDGPGRTGLCEVALRRSST